MATPYNLVSGDAQLRLTEFSDQYFTQLALQDAPSTWAKDFGLVYSSNALRTIYPLNVSAAGYKLRQGDDKMRRLYEKSLSIMPVEYSDGVNEKRQIIEAPEFIDWGGEPARIAVETQRFPNILVAQLLKDNPTLAFDGLSFFNDAHPINVLDDTVSYLGLGSTFTFDNNFSSAAMTTGKALFETAATYFRKLPGPNGMPMGMRLSHVIVPPELEKKFEEALTADFMYSTILGAGDSASTNRAQTNIYKGSIQLVVAPELQDADVVYWVAANGPKPWIVQDGGTPEEIRYDIDSDYYKDTGLVGIKYVLTMGTAAALPHAIARQQIT